MRSALLSSFSRLGNWRGLIPPWGPSIIKTRCRKAQNNNQVQQQHTRYEVCWFGGCFIHLFTLHSKKWSSYSRILFFTAIPPKAISPLDNTVFVCTHRIKRDAGELGAGREIISNQTWERSTTQSQVMWDQKNFSALIRAIDLTS